MQLPEVTTQPRKTPSTLVNALARTFRWKRMLESGEFATLAELADRKSIAPSYVTRIFRLAPLAPGLVEAILDGSQWGKDMTLELELALEPFPLT